ncbi:hypothetical protein CJ030_MR7G022006 [Morella rubra]|uniref:Uncharacterized protein n=1 Tax=Morella rubra TaxID=262757 RepID=A0A6A1UYJ3_9ROSI|nr:hypothetical protein CJ030_MR7G022006 [Morella rubra]
MTMSKAEEEKEGKESLVMVSTIKVVEYLEPSMSKELLCKFPDNSAFDFDYTQSSIWSPLVNRAYSPMDLDFDLDIIMPRKLSFGMGLDMDFGNKNQFKKAASNIKKKTRTTALNINLNLLKMKHKRQIKSSEFSPSPMKNTGYPSTTKGWNKVLKAASKHFKKKKKRDHTAYWKSNYLGDGNISR